MYKLIRNGDRAGVQLAVQREPALLDAPVTRNKHTPLMFALLKGSGGQPAIAQWLIESGAKRNLQDNLGWTALMFACRHNQRDTARLLIECGVELDLQNKKGWTALMFACCYAQPDTARLLIERGAKLDLQDDEGGTAFMIACSRQPSTPDLLRCVRLCFAAGANVELRKKDGRDALALAKDAERADAVALLEFATALEATRRQQQLQQEQQKEQQQHKQQEQQKEQQQHKQEQEQSSPRSVVTTSLQSQDEVPQKSCSLRHHLSDACISHDNVELDAIFDHTQTLYEQSQTPLMQACKGDIATQRSWTQSSSDVCSSPGKTSLDDIFDLTQALYDQSQTLLIQECRRGEISTAKEPEIVETNIDTRGSSGMTPRSHTDEASDENQSFVTTRKELPALLSFLRSLPLAQLQTNTLREMVVELLDQGVQTMNDARHLGFSRLAQLGICSAQDRQLFVKAFGENENHSKLEALAATVAFARGLRDDGKPVLHKMLRSALTHHLKPSSTLEALLNVDTDQADIHDQAALFSKIQSAGETTSTKANMRNTFRKKLVDSVRNALANGMQDHLDNFENFYDMQHIVDSYRTLWKDILCEPVSCETCPSPITFEDVQRATEAALKALTEWETRYDTSAARERTLASIRALDASTTSMGMRHTFYMTLMHPERMPELQDRTQAVETAFRSELKVLCAEEPLKNAPRKSIQHALSVTLSFYEQTVADKVARTKGIIKCLENLLASLEPGLEAPDTHRAESLVKDLRDSRKKRKRIARKLEDAKEDAHDGDDDARAEIPKLERELAKIGSVYKLDSRLRKERARVLRHAEMHYPELLGDQEWLKRIGISDGVPLELSKAGLWLSHVKRESFATLAELASKPGKTVQKVRASDGRTLVLKTFHLANDTWSGRFYRQVVALAEMRSAYVVRIEGAFMQDAQHGCVIMPYYPGGDLFSWIRDNAHADAATRKRIAIGLLSGLHDLHSRNLVHCDMKPENIFLARGLSPVLGDFDGVQTHDVTMTQPLQATVKYIAPELRSGNVDKVEPAVDMYSVGMVLKELFQNCQMPPALQNLTKVLTARNPRERPSALVALRHQAFQVEPVPVGACAICLDTFPIAKVVACDDAHFTCKKCLQQAIQAAAEPGGHVQILANGSIKCITPDCDLHISGRTIAAAVPEEDYEVLQKIVRKHTERELAREHERDVQRRVDKVLRDHGLDPETQNHLRKIQNEILTMLCPRCSAAFADFSGCCALKCGNDCSCYFCAWCLKDTGNNSQGCHQHIANCPSKRSADPYFADFGTVQEAWAQIRTQRLRHYMTERIQNDDIRKKVLEKLQQLLTSDIIGAPFRL